MPVNTRREVIVAALAAAGLGASACTSIVKESPQMETSLSADSVIRFLNHFEDVAMKEDFNLLRDT